ncbi:MAG: hotdog fold thioesterase [Candidatus Rokuibacteriota bacterium]
MPTPGPDPRRIEQAAARFARDPFARSMGVAIAALDHDRATLALPYRAEHMNAVGVLNGGASATLLLMAGALAAWTGVDLEADLHLGCVDLAVQYLASSTGEDVEATARVLRRARDLAFLDVDVRSRAGAPVCHGLVTYRTADYGGRSPRRTARHAPLPAPAPAGLPEPSRLFRGYVAKLGMTPAHQEPGRVRLTMPCGPAHLDEQGRMHAGVVASIVDIAAVAASWSMVTRRPGIRGSTIAMQVSFPDTAAAPVVAEAHVHERAEALLFNTVHVTAPDSGRLLALGQVSYRLLEPWPEAPGA